MKEKITYYDYFRTLNNLLNAKYTYSDSLKIVNNMVYKANKITAEPFQERRMNHLQRQQYGILEKCITNCLGMPKGGKQSCDIYEPYKGPGCLWYNQIQEDWNVNQHDPKKRCTFNPEVIGYFMEKKK